MNLKFYPKATATTGSFKRSLVFCFVSAILLVNNAMAQSAGALTFDGVDDNVSIPVKPALNISQNITLEAWIKPTKTMGVQDIMTKITTTNSTGYNLRTISGWSTLEFNLYFNGIGNRFVRVTYGTAKANQWHHVAATYDGFTMKVYVDAVLAGSANVAGSILVNNNPLSLGYQPGISNSYFGGSMDEVRIFNRALSQCEIANSMNCELPLPQDGLVAYYKFNQGLLGGLNVLETTLNDASTTGANGTLNNFGLLNLNLTSNWTGGNVSGTCSAFTPPTVTASAEQLTVPQGGDIHLLATTSQPGATYSWVGANGFTSTEQNPVISGVATNATGTYTVTSSVGGCSASAAVIVSVAPLAGGLSFDGVDDYIMIPDAPQFNSTRFSIEAWIYPTSGGQAVIQNVLSKASIFTNTGFRFPMTEDRWNSFSFQLSVNGQFVYVTAPIPGSGLNKWSHVAATFDGYFMRIYLNGVLVGTREVTGTVSFNNNNVLLGNNEGRGEYFKGKLDELRFWDRAISQCEIINNMQTCELNGVDNGGLGAQIALGGYYRFNQGLVNLNNAPYTVLADSSGHANNGTLTNFALSGTESNWIDGKINGICDHFVMPTLAASANGSVFQTGSTAQLFAVNGNNNNYTWEGPNTFASTNQNITFPNAQPALSGTYTVSTPYVNCIVTASTRITVSDAPQIIPDGSTNICPSSSVGLTSANVGTTYQWYKNDVLIPGATAQKYFASASGEYSVVVTTGSDVIISTHITVTVVQDVTAPVVTVASLPTLTGDAPFTVTTIPTANDNCRGVVNGTADRSLTFNQAGTFTITWTYDDGNGNTTTQTQNVVITKPSDITPPVITVPANVVVTADIATCGTTASYADATATDDSGDPVTITYSQASGTWFPTGTTTVTVTAVDATGNRSTATFTVTVNPAPVAPITGAVGVCMGASTMLSTASTGGIWRSDNPNIATVDGNGIVTGVNTGTANISYTNSCGAVASATIMVSAKPRTPNVNVVNSCGTSVLTASNTTGTLLWSNNATTNSITVSDAGTYSVTQTINGCTSDAGSDVANPKTIPATPIVTVVDNCGTSTLTVSNPVGQLNWSNNANTTSITVSAAGTYSVTQKLMGCTSAAGSGVAAPKAIPGAPVVNVVNNCDGTSTLTASNTTGTLLWSNNATTASITVSDAATYSVTQTVNGCTSAAGSGVSAPKTTPATPIVAVVDNCGTSTLTVSNQTGALLWSNNATTASITASAPGTYSVTQTINGCTSAAGISVAAPKGTPSAPTVVVVNNCDGTSTLTASNVTGTLSWSNNATSASITVSAPGTYTVSQNVNGCISAMGSGTAAPKTTPASPAVTVVDNCNGTSTLTASNITGSLLWSNNATTASITVSNAGTYSVTQTVNGCTSVAATGVAAPKTAPSAPVVTVVNNCDGTSTLTASNTTGSLLWSNNATTASITVSNAATYSVTQTVNGCTSAAGSGVSAPKTTPATPIVTVVNNCDGTSTLTASNASGSLLWSNNATTTSITVLSAGTYSVTQTANGCTSAAGSGVAAPKTAPSAPVVTVVNNCDGTSTLTASNTTGSLLWSNNATTASITVSNTATYSVTQTVDGCVSAAGSGVSAPKTKPSSPVVTVVNNCDGTSTLTASNTTGSLLWSNNATTASITVSAAGTYTVTQNVNGCTSAAGSGIAAPKSTPATPVVIVVDNCGSSTLTVSNATGSLLWSNNATTASINVTNAATYSVTQTVNGCTSAAGTGTSNPKAIQAVPVITVTNNCGSTTLSTNSGGNLVWSNNATGSSINVTSGGNYSVTATNAAGCSATSATANVTVNAIPVVAAITGTTTVTTGSATQLSDATTGGVWSSNSANATVSGSGLVTGVTAGQAIISYTVTSSAGCVTAVNTTVTVQAPACTTPAISAIANINANTASQCSAAVSYTTTVTGTPAPAITYTFTGATTGSGSGTGSGATFNLGTTTVTINAANACGNVSTSFTITVKDLTAPVVTAVANQTFCGTSGSYTVPALSASDNCGVTSVTYAITGATSRTGTGYNASGTFNAGTSTITWTVKDAANNSTTSTTTVTVGSAAVAAITASASGDFCSDLMLTGSSSIANATFKWVLGSTVVGTTQQYSLGRSSAEGTYQLFVTVNGCTSTAASYTFSKQDVLSSYTILATKNAMFGKYAKVLSGSVGVTASNGVASFKGNTVVSGDGSFVKAANVLKNSSDYISRIITGTPATVSNIPAMQYNTSSASSYPNYTTGYYTNVTLNGNYKTLTIKAGTYATLNGTIFGTIDLEQGASVRFTNATINIDKLLVEDGARDGYYSYVRFAPNTSVRVSSTVSIGSQVLVNPDNYRVTFYMADNSNDAEHFDVKGADTKLIANIVMPKGKLNVTSTDSDDDNHGNCNHGAHYWWNCSHMFHNHKDCDHKGHSSTDCNDDVYMTGTFIVEEVESKGNTVIWNSFDCNSSSVPVVVVNKTGANAATVATTSITKESAETVAATEEDLKITVMPNPSTTYFTLKFESKYQTPVNMRVMDASGRVVDAQAKIGSNSTIRIGANYASGTYFAEMIQGSVRKVIQLMKVK